MMLIARTKKLLTAGYLPKRVKREDGYSVIGRHFVKAAKIALCLKKTGSATFPRSTISRLIQFLNKYRMNFGRKADHLLIGKERRKRLKYLLLIVFNILCFKW